MMSSWIKCLIGGWLVAQIGLSQVSAQVLECEQIRAIEAQVDAECWVFFDLDETLFASATYLGSEGWFRFEYEQWVQSGHSPEEFLYCFYPRFSCLQRRGSFCVVEKDSASFIGSLQARGIKVLGLTRRGVPLRFATIAQLKSMGISFAKELSWPSFEVSGGVTPARYHEGVLFVADLNDKGTMLRHFFQHLGVTPKKIICVDDQQSYLAAIEKAFEGTSVQVFCFHFTNSFQHRAFDVRASEVQSYFLTRILPDKAAELLLDPESSR